VNEILMRLALFTVLPVLLGAAIVIFDRTAVGPVRRAEAFLIPLFIVGVGGGGISAFIAHVVISGPAARSFGSEPGSPLQLQVAFASLAIGLLGAVAAERRDGFREATVAAASVFGIGATVVQFMDIAATGGFAPGNALQAVSDLATPVLLIWLLVTLRRTETEPPNIVLRSWMVPVRRGSVATVAIAASALPVGYATGQVTAMSLAAMGVAAVAFWWIVSRSPSRRPSA
jgi:hypothetical protein